MRRLVLSAAGAVAALVACTDVPSAPGKCPDFCPVDSIAVIDTVLDVIRGDSAYRGYETPQTARTLLAVNVPGYPDSRPIFRLLPVAPRIRPFASDTTTQAWAPGRAQLVLTIELRDTLTRNLQIGIYRLPDAKDSAATFADLQTAFGLAPVRTVNVDSLLALPNHVDSATGDSAIVGDTIAHSATLYLALDTALVKYDPTDSGQVSFGLRVSADTLAYIPFGSLDGGSPPQINWYQDFDSSGTTVTRRQGARARWDTFVTDSAPAGVDSLLVVGGMPSARTLLRFDIPRNIIDSTQVVRATLELVPARPAPWAPGDSVFVETSRVTADFGAKSPIAIPLSVLDSTAATIMKVPTGSTDTVKVEVTRLVRFWQAVDTTAPRALLLWAGGAEGTTFSELSFFSTRSTAYRPKLHLTYVPRYGYGAP